MVDRLQDVGTPLVEEPTEEEIKRREKELRKKTDLWVPVSPESFQLLKQTWADQGNQSDPTAEKNSYLGDWIGRAASQVTGQPAQLAKDDLNEWTDEKENKIEYGQLQLSGIPQTIKRRILAEATSNLLGVPLDAIEGGLKPYVSEGDTPTQKFSKRAAQGANELLFGVPFRLGHQLYDKLPGKAENYNPYRILTPEEAKVITDLSNSKGESQEVQVGPIKAQYDASLDLETNLRRAAAEKIYFSWDLMHDGLQQALTQDLTLATQFLPALRAVKAVDTAAKAAKMSTALKAVDFVSNPVTAALKPTTGVGRIAAGTLESAIPRIPISDTKKEEIPSQMAFQAAVGGTIGVLAEGLAEGVRAATQEAKRNRVIKSMATVDTLETKHDLGKILSGEEVPDVPITQDDIDVMAGRYFAEKLGIDRKTDPRIPMELVGRVHKDPQIRAVVDTYMLAKKTTVPREKNLMDVKKVIDEIHSDSDLKVELRDAVSQLELAYGENGRPSADADPYLISAMAGDSESFTKAIVDAYPQIENILYKMQGQTSIDKIYKRQFINMLKEGLFPDEIKDSHGDYINNSGTNKVLNGFVKWMDTNASDNASIQKLVRNTSNIRNKFLGVGEELATAVKQVRDSFITPKEFASTPAEEVSKLLQGRRRPNEMQVVTAKAAAEGMLKKVSDAIEGGHALGMDYMTTIRTQFAGTIEKETLNQIEGIAAKFNTLQGKLVEQQSKIHTMINKRIYMAQKRVPGRAQTPSESILDRVYSDINNIDARLMDEFIEPIRKKKLPIEPVNDIVGMFPAVAEYMKAGKVIPEELLQQVSEATMRLVDFRRANKHPPIYLEKTKNFNGFLSLYNRQTNALNIAEDSAMAALDDSNLAPQAMVQSAHLTSVISNEILQQRLERIQAIASDLMATRLANSSLPESSRYKVMEALSGNAITNLKMYATGAYNFRSYSHIVNMFESMKNNPREALDSIDKYFIKLFGYAPDREFMLGMFWNPGNFHGKDKYLQQIQIDPDKIEFFAKLHETRAKRSNRRLWWFQSPEVSENRAARDSGIATLASIELLNKETVRAQIIERDNFSSTRDKLQNMLVHMHGESNWAIRKLGGSRGLAAINQFFYGTHEQMGFRRTALGDLQYRLFTEYNDVVREALQDRNTTNGRNIFTDAVMQASGINPKSPATPETIESIYSLSNSLFDYFNHPYHTEDWMSSNSWKKVWEFTEFLENERLRAHKISSRILVEQNREYAQYGVTLPPPRWREHYVHKPAKLSALNFDDFQSTLYKDFDNSRYFGSSDKGQISKAENFDIGFSADKVNLLLTYDTPAISLMKYIQHSLMDAQTAHVRLILEDHAVSLKDLGYHSSAEYYQSATRDRLRKWKIISPWGEGGLGMALWTPLYSTPVGRMLGLWAKPIAANVLRTAQPVMVLNKPKALVKNAIQQAVRTSLQTTNPIKGALEGSEAFARNIANMRDNDTVAMGVSPDLHRHMIRDLEVFRDTADRESKELTAILAAASLEGNKSEKALLGTKGGLALARADVATREFIQRNFKERLEYAGARSNAEIGARVYEKTIRIIDESGLQKAFEYLSGELPQKPTNQIWELVRATQDGMDAGNPYLAHKEFFMAWLSSRVGRYGAMAVPQWAASFAPLLPNTFRFFAAKTQDLFLAGDVLWQSGEWLNDAKPWKYPLALFSEKARDHVRWGKLPSQQRIRAGYFLLYSAATWMGLKAINDGVGYFMGMDSTLSSIRDDIRASEEDTSRRKAIDGLGIDLTSYLPASPQGWSDSINGIMTTRGGFAPPSVVESWNTLHTIFSNAQDLVSGGNWSVVETQISKAKDALDAIEPDSRNMDNPKYVEALGEYQDKLREFNDTAVPRLMDYLLESIAPTSIIPLLQDPIMNTMVMMDFKEKGPHALSDTSVPYRGPITDLNNLWAGGNIEKLQSFTPEELDAWKASYIEGGDSEEWAQQKIELMDWLRNSMVEADERAAYLIMRDTKKNSKLDFTSSIREKLKERHTLYPQPEGKDYETLPQE